MKLAIELDSKRDGDETFGAFKKAFYSREPITLNIFGADVAFRFGPDAAEKSFGSSKTANYTLVSLSA